MKKFWIFALVLTVFTVAGLGAQERTWWYLARGEGGSAAPNSTVNLRLGRPSDERAYIYIYFRMAQRSDSIKNGNFTKVRLNFTLSTEKDIYWQCVYYEDMQGGVLGSERLAGSALKTGPIETDFSHFTMVWSGRDRTLTTSKMSGLCLAIPYAVADGTVSFTLTGVELLP